MKEHEERDLARAIHHLIERINAMALDFTKLTDAIGRIEQAAATSVADKAALVQAQADAVAAQRTIDDLTAAAVATLPTPAPGA